MEKMVIELDELDMTLIMNSLVWRKRVLIEKLEAEFKKPKYDGLVIKELQERIEKIEKVWAKLDMIDTENAMQAKGL